MADVILIQCPPWDTKFPPLGLAYLASNLNKKGITAEVVDLNIDIYNDSLDKNSWEMKQFQYWNEPSFVKSVISQHKANISCSIRQIVESSPRIIGFSLNSANFLFSYEILKAIKHRLSDVLVCMGGPGITYEHGRYLIERFKEIDFAILGEAEDILPRILMERRTKKKIMNLPGVLSIHNSRRFIPLEPLKRLDELAFPTFLEFDLSKYENKDTIHMITSRGCLYRCNFCFDWTQRKHYSYRTAENILQEIESHLANHRIRKFLFRDLIINGNLENLKKLCDMIIQKKLDIEWTAQGTVDNRIGMEFAMAMKKAGLRIYTMGVESCSDKVLREMNKPYKREHLREFIITLHKAKIFSTMNIIVGHPAEGEQEFMETYNFIKENHNYIPRLSSITTCALIEGTMLTKIRDRYDIVLPKNDLLMNDKSWFKWYTKDLKNTFSVRKKREKKLIDLCNELGIEIENTFNEDLEI